MRYIILLIINLPIITISALDLITNYKLNKIPRSRFIQNIIFWTILMIVIIGSFPIYNLLNGKYLLDSSELSLFDIAEITAIIYMIYTINTMRIKSDAQEKRLRDLHQELSIRLSDSDKK